MDRPESQQKDGDADATNASSVQETGRHHEAVGGPTEASRDRKSVGDPPPAWKHNQELSFNKIRDNLKLLEAGTRQAISQAEEEVKRLVAIRKRMTGR